MDYILGKTNEDINVTAIAQYKSITASLAKQAHHSIDIFTQDLEAAIYNNLEIEQSIFTLSKRHPNTCIRILVQDSSQSVNNGHRLIKISQQLTSSVFIHNPPSKYKNEQGSFMVADGNGFIHRTLAMTRTYQAKANFKSPKHSEQLINFFNKVWEQSIPDIQTRRVYL